MTRLLAIGNSTNDREAADYFTCLDFLELLYRYKNSLNNPPLEVRSAFQRIAVELKEIGMLQ